MTARRSVYVKQYNRKPEPVESPCFFTKSQLVVGAVLRHLGRLDPNSNWKVTSIRTGFNQKGAYASKEVKTVRHLNDDVYLSRIGGKVETRVCQFSYLSYSAIWWLK